MFAAQFESVQQVIQFARSFPLWFHGHKQREKKRAE